MIKSIAVALLIAAPLYAETIEFSSSFKLRHSASEFGGLSGIEVVDQGRSFFAVSDKGTIWRGNFERDANGHLQSANNVEFQKIKTSKGNDVDGQNIDAEGMDSDSKGRLYISFESNTRVSMFEKWDDNATLIQRPSEFLNFGYNSGPEAMAIGADDSILVVPERSGDLNRAFPIYTRKGQTWTSDRGIPRKPPYLVVGMDYDDASKRLYVLERDFKFPVFSTRIRSFHMDKSSLSDEQVLLTSKYGQYGDLEGMSLWRDANDQAYLTLIADDNFSAFYSTEVVEFKILPE